MFTAAFGSALHAQTPVPQLDEAKFPGVWHEIAHLPNKREKNCVRDYIQLIALSDKKHSWDFVFSCTDKDAYDDIDNKRGHAKHGTGDIAFPKLFIFHTHYLVLAYDPAYNWALAGSPNHKDLWLLSKTPTLDDATVADLRSRAAAMGYPVDKLILTQQPADDRHDTIAPAATPTKPAATAPPKPVAKP